MHMGGIFPAVALLLACIASADAGGLSPSSLEGLDRQLRMMDKRMQLFSRGGGGAWKQAAAAAARAAAAEPASRKLQPAAVCEWVGEKCGMKTDVGMGYVSGLPEASAVRQLYMDWTMCHALDQAACTSSDTCKWEFAKGCDVFTTSYDLPFFDMSNCGIYGTIFSSSRSEKTCAKTEGACTSVEHNCMKVLDLTADGTCEADVCKPEPSNLYALCGDSFNLGLVYQTCPFSSLPTEAERNDKLAECLTTACPKLASYWNASAFSATHCSPLTETTCDSSWCEWDKTGAGQCRQRATAIVAASVDDSCKVKRQLDVMVESEALCESASDVCPDGCVEIEELFCESHPGAAPVAETNCRGDSTQALMVYKDDGPEECAYLRIGVAIEECEQATTEAACLATTPTDFTCQSDTTTTEATTTVPTTTTAATTTTDMSGTTVTASAVNESSTTEEVTGAAHQVGSGSTMVMTMIMATVMFATSRLVF